MKWIDDASDAADQFQQRWPWLAFPVAVWRKFGDDQAGNLAALIAYYAFIALFPLLLLLVTVLDITLKNNPALRRDLLDSALAQYPIIGQQLHLGSLPTGGLPELIGILFLLFGSRGVARAMRNALCTVWDVPKERQPGFPLSNLLDIGLALAVGIGLVVTTTLSGLAGGVGNMLNGMASLIGTVAVSLVLNLGMFWYTFRIATVRRVPWRDLWVGAAISAVFWQILQVTGGYLVSHRLHRASELYGTFGLVLGLLAWLFLQAEVTLYASEIAVVRARRLWPRSLKSDAGLESETGGRDSTDKEQGRRHDRRAA
jgi:YihY family inner membrane protein